MEPIPIQKSEPNALGEAGESRASAWATPVSRLTLTQPPKEAVNINVAGRQVTGPLQGFGQLWQKTYKVRLSNTSVSPQQVIKVWKEKFPQFWPQGNHFYAPLTGIQPGEVALLNLAGPGGITGPKGMPMISTGVMVIYADEESFSFMTPQGHIFAALITFSASEEDHATTAQVQALIRASDPLYELGLRLGVIHKTEDEFWHETLRNLASHFGVAGYVQQQVTCVDRRLRWSEAKNIYHNAAVRTFLYMLASPFRWIGRLVRPKKASA